MEILDQFKFVRCFHADNVKPGKFCAMSPSSLFCQYRNFKNVLQRLDCSNTSPKCSSKTNLIKSNGIKDMCCTNDTLMCLYEGCPGLYAQTFSGSPLWSVERIVTGRHTYDMNCISVATYDKGHIFVCDSNHNCVRLFSTGGEHMGCLENKENMNFGHQR